MVTLTLKVLKLLVSVRVDVLDVQNFLDILQSGSLKVVVCLNSIQHLLDLINLLIFVVLVLFPLHLDKLYPCLLWVST